MGLDASVHCNCVKEGKARPHPFPELWAFDETGGPILKGSGEIDLKLRLKHASRTATRVRTEATWSRNALGTWRLSSTSAGFWKTILRITSRCYLNALCIAALTPAIASLRATRRNP
jgi:hypothetical protein